MSHVVCAYCELRRDENSNRRTIPKVVFNENKELLYISRSPIPVSKKRKIKLNISSRYAYTPLLKMN